MNAEHLFVPNSPYLECILHFLFFYRVQCMGLYFCEYIIDNILIKVKL